MTFRYLRSACSSLWGVSAGQLPPEQFEEDNEWIHSSKKMLKYICCFPISFLDFLKLTLLRQKKYWRELLHWVFRDWLGPLGCVDLAALFAPNWFHHRHIERSDITKDCFFHPGQERACTRIIWLFVGHHAKDGPIYREMVVMVPLLFTSKTT